MAFLPSMNSSLLFQTQRQRQQQQHTSDKSKRYGALLVKSKGWASHLDHPLLASGSCCLGPLPWATLSWCCCSSVLRARSLAASASISRICPGVSTRFSAPGLACLARSDRLNTTTRQAGTVSEGLAGRQALPTSRPSPHCLLLKFLLVELSSLHGGL